MHRSYVVTTVTVKPKAELLPLRLRRNSIMGILLLGGFLVVVIIPVVISVVSAVVSGIAAAVDDEED